MRAGFKKQLRLAFAKSILVAVTISATASWATIASAQTQIPPEMQSQAMSLAQICRTDYERLCHDVQPGGGRIINCLRDHQSELSDACYDQLAKQAKRKRS